MKLVSYNEKQIRIKTPSGEEIILTDDSFGNTDEILLDMGRKLFFLFEESFSGRNTVLISNKELSNKEK